MDNNDENLVKDKTLIEFDQSTTSLVVKEDSHKLDLTSSESMGVRISKSQENGSGVLEDENFHGNSANGESGGVGGDDVVVEKKEGSGLGDLELEKGMNEVENDGKVNGASVGNDGSGESKQVGRKSSSEAGIQDGRSSSETKGNADVSGSIAQRTRNRAVSGKKEEIDEVDRHKGNESGDDDDEEHGFCVGDFVWGKVKSHPWWPGRIYDPSDATEYALKYKHEGRLLVGYFGDRTFAWCDPSQLKSFEENFEEMSKQSSLKAFVNAVQQAENEFGTLVKVQMTRSYAGESQSSLPLVVNAGVKEGVRVPENGIGFFTVAQFKPLAMLADIKRFALFDSVENTLELTVLKSRLSAFYHAKFGYLLPIQCEPIGIEDLTDNQGALLGPLFPGPDDGDWIVGSEDQPLGQNGPMTPVDMSQSKRKVKSIAALLGRETEDELKGQDLDKTEGETQSGKTVSKSRKKRLNVSEEDRSNMSELTGDDGSSKVEEQQSVQKSGRKKRKTVGANQSLGTDDLVVTRSSSRKKKQSSASSTASEKKASASNDTQGGSKLKSKRKIEMMPQVSVNGGSAVEEAYERISPREKKLSKYLCPPYTNILQRQRSSCSQTSSESGLVYSDVSRVGEKMAKTASKLTGSPPLVKCSAETFRKSSKVSGPMQKKTDHPDQSTSKRDASSEVNDPVKSIGSVNSVLLELQSAALDPLCSRRGQSLDSINEFMFSYRSSNYKNGSNYTSYKKSLAEDRQKKKRQKRNSSDNEQVLGQKVLDVVGQQTPKPKNLEAKSARKRKQKLESKADEQMLDQKVLDVVDQQTPKTKSLEAKSSRTRKQKLESKTEHEVGPSSSATLVITFAAPLPTEKDIIDLCSKLDGVDKSKIEVVPESLTVKIVFAQRTAAEVAMDCMQKSMPFGSVEVSYNIEHLANESSEGKQVKVNVQNKKKKKASEAKEAAANSDKHPSVSSTPKSEPLAVVFIKQKLEAMTSMVAQTDGKMSQEIKANLENEAKELLKKLKKMATTPES